MVRLVSIGISAAFVLHGLAACGSSSDASGTSQDVAAQCRTFCAKHIEPLKCPNEPSDPCPTRCQKSFDTNVSSECKGQGLDVVRCLAAGAPGSWTCGPMGLAVRAATFCTKEEEALGACNYPSLVRDSGPGGGGN